MTGLRMRGRHGDNRIPTGESAAGFTLVELLIVLAILSVLFAILFPVFASARRQSQRAVCFHNMRQASIAFNLYTQDYDEVFPTFHADARLMNRPGDLVLAHDYFCQGLLTGFQDVTWTTVTAAYAGRSGGRSAARDADAFRCPRDRRDPMRFETSYEYKLWLAEGQSMPAIPDPSTMALLWEQWDFHASGTHAEHDRRARMNMSFVDGHVRWINLADTSTARYGDGPNLHDFFPGTGGRNTPGADVVTQ